VFEGAMPNVNLLLQTVGDECALCCMAGASKLNEFLMRSPAHHSQVLRPKGSLFLFGCVFFFAPAHGVWEVTPLESGYVNFTRCSLSLNEMIHNSPVSKKFD
jgi:hypothetical protein